MKHVNSYLRRIKTLVVPESFLIDISNSHNLRTSRFISVVAYVTVNAHSVLLNPARDMLIRFAYLPGEPQNIFRSL